MLHSPSNYRRATTLPPRPRNHVTTVFRKGSSRRGSGLFALAVWATAGLSLAGRTATATPTTLPTVKIAIDDYAAVDSDQIIQAQRLVTQLYDAIGVKTSWLETRRVSNDASGARMRADLVAPDLRVIVLEMQTPDREDLSPDAAGSAPGTRTERGRIAYVFYDRVRTIAQKAHQVDGSPLGVVIAHEIGHLLLPYGSHSETGLMRGLWSAQEIRRIDVRTLAFTPSQAREIRLRVSGEFSGP
jgi:hypothetical protein